MHQEITVKGLTKHLVSALLAAEDMEVVDKYDVAVVAVKVDGRNEKGEHDTEAKYMPVALLDNLTDPERVKVLENRPELTEEEKVQEFNTLKLQRLLKSVRNDYFMPENDPLNKDQPFRLPPRFFNLRKYLSHLEWPPAKYAAFEIRIQLFERNACRVLSTYKEKEYSDAYKLDWIPTDPNAEPKRMLFRYTKKRADEIRQLYSELQFSIGEDSIRPFLGMKLNLISKTPAAFAERGTKDELFSSLSTERSFMGQIYNQAESVHTPDAYKSVLKLMDIEGLVKRAMIKSLLILLAMLEDDESQTVDKDILVADWKRTFKEKVVMLVVTTFVFSADKGFLNGEIFARSVY